MPPSCFMQSWFYNAWSILSASDTARYFNLVGIFENTMTKIDHHWMYSKFCRQRLQDEMLVFRERRVFVNSKYCDIIQYLSDYLRTEEHQCTVLFCRNSNQVSVDNRLHVSLCKELNFLHRCKYPNTFFYFQQQIFHIWSKLLPLFQHLFLSQPKTDFLINITPLL